MMKMFLLLRLIRLHRAQEFIAQLLGSSIQLTLFLLVFFVLVPCTAANAEPFGLGFPEFDPRASILDSTELLPTVVRNAVTATLTQAPRAFGNTSLSISDSMSVSADYSRWSFKIRASAHFADKVRVTPRDVAFSLERCSSKKVIPMMQSVTVHDEPLGTTPPWVELQFALDSSVGAALAAKKVLEALGDCPILERKSSIIFAEDLGFGANIVSAGPYAISSFIPGRKYILDRVRRSSRDRAGVEQIELRAFADADQGLAALRVGTIGGFACANPTVIERARHDETLQVSACRGYSMLSRKQSGVECVENLSVVELRGNT